MELVRRRVRKAQEIVKKDRWLISGEEIKLIETILDYLDRNTQATCFGWMGKILDVGTQEEIALTEEQREGVA